MSTYWSPRPLRPASANPIFEMVEPEPVIKGLSPMQRQRLEDGTPITRSGPTALRPADPMLVLRPELSKGSLAEKLEEKNPKYGAPRQDPQEPLGVIKSYLEKAELTSAKREKLKESSFALPDDRAYPIHDEVHARNALARVAQHGTKAEQKKVREAVAKKYPGIEISGDDDDEGDPDDEDTQKSENYTKPELRDKIKRQVMAGSDGGKPGQWSARKAQLVAQKYKEAGGGYKGARTEKQRSLSKWTDEKWTTSDGKPAKQSDGSMRRYLPEKAWKELSSEEKEATNKKKVEGSKKGKQFISNTEAAKEAREEHTKKSLELFAAAVDRLHESLEKSTGKYSHINFTPPDAVSSAAARGLEYRSKASPSNRGGLTPEQASKEGIGSGVQRATNLKNKDTVSPGTISQMVAFFSRHAKNKSVAPEHKNEPWNDKGYVAWLLWGGDPGKTWAEKVKAQMDKADEK